MRDMLAPGGCNGDGTVGGLPAVACDPVPAIAYSYDVHGNWVEDLGGGGNAVVIGIGPDLSGVDPTPAPGSWSVDTRFAIEVGGPVSSPPLDSQVPGSWQDAPTSVGAPSFVLPLAFLPITTGTRFWMRNLITDEGGCVATWLVWFPEGMPADWTSPVHGWFKVNDGAWTEFTLPGSTEDPTLIDAVVESVGVCPPAVQAVGVAPACEFNVTVHAPEGAPLPVFLSGEAPEFPNALRVVGQVAGDQGDDLKVTLDGEAVALAPDQHVKVEPGDDPLQVELPAAVELVLALLTLDSPDASGDPVEGVAAAGASIMRFQVTGDSTDSTVLVNIGGNIIPQRFADGSWEYLTLTAPEGKVLPAFACTVRGGVGAVQLKAIGFYTP